MLARLNTLPLGNAPFSELRRIDRELGAREHVDRERLVLRH